MTGIEFEKAMIELGYNQVGLAERLGTNRQAIARQMKSDNVDEVYACALRWLVAENAAKQLAKVL